MAVPKLNRVWIIATSLHVASPRINLLFIMAIINATWFKREEEVEAAKVEVEDVQTGTEPPRSYQENQEDHI